MTKIPAESTSPKDWSKKTSGVKQLKIPTGKINLQSKQRPENNTNKKLVMTIKDEIKMSWIKPVKDMEKMKL